MISKNLRLKGFFFLCKSVYVDVNQFYCLDITLHPLTLFGMIKGLILIGVVVPPMVPYKTPSKKGV